MIAYILYMRLYFNAGQHYRFKCYGAASDIAPILAIQQQLTHTTRAIHILLPASPIDCMK